MALALAERTGRRCATRQLPALLSLNARGGGGGGSAHQVLYPDAWIKQPQHHCQGAGYWRHISSLNNSGGGGEASDDGSSDGTASMKKSLKKLYGSDIDNDGAIGSSGGNSSSNSTSTSTSNQPTRTEKRASRQMRRGHRWRRKGDDGWSAKIQGDMQSWKLGRSIIESLFEAQDRQQEGGDELLLKKSELGGASEFAADGNEGSGAAGQSGGNGDDQSNSSSGDSLITQSSYPYVLPFPLHHRPLLPGQQMSIQINDKRASGVLKRLYQDGQGYVATFLSKDRRLASNEDKKDKASVNPSNGLSQVLDFFAPLEQDNKLPGQSSSSASLGEKISASQELIGSLEEVGTLASFSQVISVPGNGVQILLQGHRRVRRQGIAALPEGLRVQVTTMKDNDADEYKDNDEFQAVTRLVANSIQELFRISPILKELITWQHIEIEANRFSRLADVGAVLTAASADELQKVLETTDVKERLMLTFELLKKEVELTKLQSDISRRVQEKITEHNRRYYLEQQLKSIKKELGMEKDEKSSLVQKFKDRIEADPPLRERASEEVMKTIDEELEKLSGLEPNSSELSVTRNYLEWLTKIPWNIFSEDTLDIKNAQKVLDEDHHGLEEVKERILEFIAVSQLRGTAHGKILLLSGPPGVGKTSIGKSIARALNRKFYRFSVGGLTDVAEIKGHRRTYVGALPGKIVQCLKTTQTSNPLVLIDEVDKLGRGYQGDPASTLLELLDPEQNSAFDDHYLDVPVDLSKVLFVCTANVVDAIPEPLFDRMENIPLSGYIASEKLQIATKYLIPESMKKSGVHEDQCELTEGAARELIENYCREAGVRNLQKHIDKIFRKTALKIVKAEGEKEKITISEEQLKDLVGNPVFTPDKFYETTPPGVVMGLAWTASGGSTLYVETSVTETGEGKGSIKTTGQLGNVMKESTLIAHSVARDQLRKIDKSNRFFSDSALHLHVPAGATPKDGPSAGVVMVTSMLSQALNLSVVENIAMTGEVSLTGRLLPIGGVREKTIAARRSGVTTLIFPEANQRDYEELPEHIRDGLTVHFLKWYDQVLPLAFPSVSVESTE